MQFPPLVSAGEAEPVRLWPGLQGGRERLLSLVLRLVSSDTQALSCSWLCARRPPTPNGKLELAL